MSPDYEKTSVLLNQQNIPETPSFIHGLLSGLQCGGALSTDIPVLAGQLLLDGFEPPEIIRQLFIRLDEELVAQLEEDDFAFQPLLPDDEEDISQRLYALAKYCEGFSLGFGGAWEGGDAGLPDETREVLKDFAAIAELDDHSASQESDEEDLMEVIEYVRMAVNAVYLQHAKKISGKTSTETRNLH